MPYIFLNLKRFDIPPLLGGVNRIAPPKDWGREIINKTREPLERLSEKAEIVMFFPEAHIIPAAEACGENGPVQIGCQSVFRADTAPDANFGAFTSNRTANAMRALGCNWTIIGHCEERRDKLEILSEGGGDASAVNRLLNRQIKCAEAAGLKTLYCIGETQEEQSNWRQTLHDQLAVGLNGVNRENLCIAYEPVWAIGPGKTPPNKEYIQMIASFIKEEMDGIPVVYGGGLKADNAAMLASIPEIDGGLIALTRFTGEIGFYPDEYIKIISIYLEG